MNNSKDIKERAEKSYSYRTDPFQQSQPDNDGDEQDLQDKPYQPDDDPCNSSDNSHKSKHDSTAPFFHLLKDQFSTHSALFPGVPEQIQVVGALNKAASRYFLMFLTLVVFVSRHPTT